MGSGEAAVILIGLAGIYFLPWLVAWARHSRRIGGVFVLNLFLGWTVLGWVIALAWAAGSSTDQPETRGATKVCPYCAETILAAAIACKHCGRDLPGQLTAG